MKKHIELLGILQIIYNIFSSFIGIGFLVFFPRIALISGDPTAISILTLIGTFLGCFFFVLSIPGIIAGVGLLKTRPWARILTIIIACFEAIILPIGTALSVYALWVLINSESIKEFSQTQA